MFIISIYIFIYILYEEINLLFGWFFIRRHLFWFDIFLSVNFSLIFWVNFDKFFKLDKYRYVDVKINFLRILWRKVTKELNFSADIHFLFEDTFSNSILEICFWIPLRPFSSFSRVFFIYLCLNTILLMSFFTSFFENSCHGKNLKDVKVSFYDLSLLI